MAIGIMYVCVWSGDIGMGVVYLPSKLCSVTFDL